MAYYVNCCVVDNGDKQVTHDLPATGSLKHHQAMILLIKGLRFVLKIL